jgi:uncharacterized protein YbaR (Trm112 family)
MKITYDPKEHTLRKIKHLIKEGYILICPECRSDLIVALTVEDANKHEVHPGVYCSNNKSHIGILVSLAESHKRMWEIMNKFKDS